MEKLPKKGTGPKSICADIGASSLSTARSLHDDYASLSWSVHHESKCICSALGAHSLSARTGSIESMFTTQSTPTNTQGGKRVSRRSGCTMVARWLHFCGQKWAPWQPNLSFQCTPRPERPSRRCSAPGVNPERAFAAPVSHLCGTQSASFPARWLWVLAEIVYRVHNACEPVSAQAFRVFERSAEFL